MEEVRPGVFVYDMGQNMVGVPKIKLSGMKPGTRICLRFAEVKYPDLPEYKGNTGMIMLENIRAAMAQDIYIAKGGEETIFPRFTYHGYRFVEITGIDEPLPAASVKGVVLSSIHELASRYETSDEKVNKLWENITWSSFANLCLSPPTALNGTNVWDGQEIFPYSPVRLRTWRTYLNFEKIPSFYA